jgi:uncharacterized membrane protein YfcA
MRLPWFIPVSFVSGLTNPVGIQAAKLLTYAAFGVLSAETATLGLAAGTGALCSIWLSRRWLTLVSTARFRRFAVIAMFASGTLILWQQRGVLIALFALT